jgi:DNA-binding XRE family transcriptional regulator
MGGARGRAPAGERGGGNSGAREREQQSPGAARAERGGGESSVLRPVPAPEAPFREPSPIEPLWREVLGEHLRSMRQDQRETLSDTAGRAGISPQYLSEIERGRKEPSSEMIAALAGALGTTLGGLTEQVAGDLRRRQDAAISRASGPVMLALAA